MQDKKTTIRGYCTPILVLKKNNVCASLTDAQRSHLGQRQFSTLISLLQIRKFRVKVAYYYPHHDHHHHCNHHHCDHHQNQLITKILKIIKHVKKSEKLKIVKIIKNLRILRNCF